MYKQFPTIVIDGVFFQLNQTGISRVWRSLLEEWQQSGFSKYIVIIDRAGTAPKLPGIQYHELPYYDFRNVPLDSERLQSVCDKFNADLFMSTYYSTPISTPTISMIYDLIPEVIGFDLTEPCWREKYYSILHASHYITISKNTAVDLIKFYPFVSNTSIKTIYCGVNKMMNPAMEEEINFFKKRFNIKGFYFLLVGDRMSLHGYKNAILFFKALSQWSNTENIEVVCVGGQPQLEPELSNFVGEIPIHLIRLSDPELRLAYSGAISLVYPSLYEGFGLPIVEAMSCGCPVITCRNSSIPEVAGDAVIYVNEYDIDGMIQALEHVHTLEIRQRLIQAGLNQAKKFSWEIMADEIANYCRKVAQDLTDQKVINARCSQLWQEFRVQQIKVNNLTSAQAFQEFENLRMELDTAKIEIEAMKTSKFWKIRNLWFKFKKYL
jgi:glycosyltransferase involved in cell wall biosynthesis